MASQSNPRVFITQSPRPNRQGWTPNLQPAEKFGTLLTVFAVDEAPSFGPDSAIFKAGEALVDFDSTRDFILSPNAGDPTSLLSCVLVLARQQRHKMLRVLVWDKSRNHHRNPNHGQYRVVNFTIPSYDF